MGHAQSAPAPSPFQRVSFGEDKFPPQLGGQLWEEVGWLHLNQRAKGSHCRLFGPELFSLTSAAPQTQAKLHLFFKPCSSYLRAFAHATPTAWAVLPTFVYLVNSQSLLRGQTTLSPGSLSGFPKCQGPNRTFCISPGRDTDDHNSQVHS